MQVRKKNRVAAHLEWQSPEKYKPEMYRPI